MKHAQDNITVGKVKFVYSEIRRGWVMPGGKLVTNPLKAQRLAEEMANKMGAL